MSTSQECIDAIHKKLNKCIEDGKTEVMISYEQVSKAFPSGLPHEFLKYSDAIKFSKLAEWADSIGWDAEPEPDNSYSPLIKFTRK